MSTKRKRNVEEEKEKEVIYIPIPHYLSPEFYWRGKILEALGVKGYRSQRLLFNARNVLPILDELIEAQGFEEIAPPEPTELISVDQGSDYWKIFRMYKPEEEENHLFFNSTFLAKIFTRSKDYIKLYNNYLGLDKISEPNDLVKGLFELGKKGEILALQKFKNNRNDAYKPVIYRPGPMTETFTKYPSQKKITIQASLDAILTEELKSPNYYAREPWDYGKYIEMTIIEVKTWCKKTALPREFSEVPDEYKMQIYFQMMVSGISYAYLLIYDIETNHMSVFYLTRRSYGLYGDSPIMRNLLDEFQEKRKKKITKKTWTLPKLDCDQFINGVTSYQL